MIEQNLWWGYKHINGSLQVKRYFGPEDLTEAESSVFVYKVHGPFKCKNREDAIAIMERVIGSDQNF